MKHHYVVYHRILSLEGKSTMVRRKGYGTILAISILLVTTLIGCAPSPAAPSSPTPATVKEASTPVPKAAAKLETVKRMVAAKSATTSNTYIGKDQGFYKEQGINLENIVMKATLGIPALINGEVDFVSHGSGITEAVAKGVDAKVLLGQFNKNIWHLMVGPGINTAQDLKGKTISVTSVGAIAHYSGRLALKHLGLDPDKDVNWIAMPDLTAQLVAMKAGTVAGAPMAAHWNILAEEQGSKELIFVGDVPGAPPSGEGLSSMTKKIKDNPDQVKRMIRATIKSMLYFRDNPKEVKDYLMKEFGMDRKAVDASYADIIRGASFTGTLLDSTVQSWVDMAKASGSIRGDFDWRKAVDLSFLKEVQQELKITP